MSRHVVLGFDRYTKEIAISEETYNNILNMDGHFPNKIKTEWGIIHIKTSELLFIEAK